VTNAKIGMGAVNSASILDNSIAEIDMSAAYKRGVANGVATLDGSGLIPVSQLPPQTITSVTMCADIPCRDAITGQQVGDVVIVMDRGDGNPETYIWDGSVWKEFLSTGVIITSTDDVPEGTTNLYYTEARVSANTDVVANSAHRAIVAGNPHGTTLGQLADVNVVGVMSGQVIAWDGVSSWVATTVSGESNTASNLGTGQGLFSAKVGADLQFYSLSAGSNKLSIAAPAMNNVALDVVPGNILHDDLGSVSANEHVDHSSIVLSGANGIMVSGTGDLTASRTITLAASLSQLSDVDNTLMPTANDILEYVGGQWTTGTKRAGTNIGMGAGDVFKQIAANTMEFRSLVDAGSGRVSISTTLNTVTLDVQEGSVNHDSLLNYVASKHVDHSMVTLGVSGGLTVDGGTMAQDITASRTLGVNTNVIQARVSGTCPSNQGIYAIDNMGNVMCATSSGDVTGPGSATDNAIVRFDGTTGKTVQNSGVTISDANAVAGAASYNGVAIDTVQVLGGTGLSNTGTATLETDVTIDLDINSLPTLSAGAVDFNNDLVAVYDSTAGTHHKMPFSDLPLFEKPAVGELYFYNQISPVTVPVGGFTGTTTTGLDNMETIGITSIFSPGARHMDNPASTQLRYTGVPSVYCHTAASLSVAATGGGGGKEYTFAIGINGCGLTQVQPNSRVRFRTNSVNLHSTAIHAYIPLSQNDYLTLCFGGDAGQQMAMTGINLFAMCLIV